MAFPTTSVIETFTGTNGTSPPNSNWTNLVGGIQIQSNAAAGTTVEYNVAAWDTSTFGADCEAFVTVTAFDATTGVGLGLRVTTLSFSTLDGYLFYVDCSAVPDVWVIFEVLDGGVTELTSTTTNIANGEKIGAEAIGSALKMYHYTGGAWSQKLSTTDATYGSAGYILLDIYHTVGRCDDFGGGTVVTGGGVVGPLIGGRLINNSHLIHGRLIR